MSLAGTGKATIARITAQRLGVKEEGFLQLIERLAAADINIGKPQFFQGGTPAITFNADASNAGGPYYLLHGTMDGKEFALTLTGPAIANFVDLEGLHTL